MSKPEDRRLDAYLAGDLSPEEQRALAQAALDDPELFDRLALAAVVNVAATSEAAATGGRPNKIRFRWMLTGAAAAIAIVVAVVSIDRSSAPPAPAATASTSRPETPSAPTPAAPPGDVSQPVLLTARLEDLSRQSSPAFRSPAEASRAPKGSGTVVTVENGEVSIDLGSLDGLTKGADVQVVRPGASAPARLTITTVFRERSRGRTVSAEAVQVGDRVDVPSALQLRALLEHVVSRIAGGDTDGARTAARRSVAVSASASDADSADAMNELAAVLIGSRDFTEAETLLRRAQTYATGMTAVRVANNLGAVTALRGDAAAAQSMYRSALALAGTAPEYEAARRAIEKNLQDLRPVR